MSTTIFEDYTINRNTLALLPGRHTDYQTIVLEGTEQIFVNKSMMELIKEACLIGGAGYKGRRESVMYLTGVKQKVMLPINPIDMIYAYPTHSSNHLDCCWIFYHHVHHYDQHPMSTPTTPKSIIHFHNGIQLNVTISTDVIKKQMQKTAVCILYFSHVLDGVSTSKASHPFLSLT